LFNSYQLNEFFFFLISDVVFSYTYVVTRFYVNIDLLSDVIHLEPCCVVLF
jgi:hypothetical protein